MPYPAWTSHGCRCRVAISTSPSSPCYCRMHSSVWTLYTFGCQLSLCTHSDIECCDPEAGAVDLIEGSATKTRLLLMLHWGDPRIQHRVLHVLLGA